MPVPIQQQPAAPQAPRRTARILPHLVAAYVIYHVLSVGIGSLPAPADALNRDSWKNPTVQSELDAWAARVQRFGWNIDRDDFEDYCFRVCQRLMGWYWFALTPFRDYQHFTGTVQAWSMFVAPHRYPSVLHIEMREPEGDWQPIYIAGSNDATWRRAQLNHIRFRSAIFRFAWPQYRRIYKSFAEWVAAQAAADFPVAREVRVRFFTYETLSPEQARAHAQPTGSFSQTLTFSLDERR